MKGRLSLCPGDGGQGTLGAQLGAAIEMTVDIELASSSGGVEGGGVQILRASRSIPVKGGNRNEVSVSCGENEGQRRARYPVSTWWCV